MNTNIILVVISILFNLITGGGIASGSIPSMGQTGNFPNYLMQMLYLYGGSINMEQSNFWQLRILRIWQGFHGAGLRKRP